MNLNEIIANALAEDLPQGDKTTDALNCKILGRAKVVAKQDLVLSGSIPFTETFRQIDSSISCLWLFKDGQNVAAGQTIVELSGPYDGLLKGERVALNFLGRLSGIATLTTQYVAAVKFSKTKILDTRKTTPGLRFLEKAAVKHGGGENHRLNLSEAVLLKENHIRAAGSINVAVDKIRERYGKTKIEVEVTNLMELDEALKCSVDQLLLDNMSVKEIAQAVKNTDGRALIEVSGGVTLESVHQIAQQGVDFISVGKITHSAPAVDVSMLFDK